MQWVEGENTRLRVAACPCRIDPHHRIFLRTEGANPGLIDSDRPGMVHPTFTPFAAVPVVDKQPLSPVPTMLPLFAKTESIRQAGVELGLQAAAKQLPPAEEELRREKTGSSVCIGRIGETV